MVRPSGREEKTCHFPTCISFRQKLVLLCDLPAFQCAGVVGDLHVEWAGVIKNAVWLAVGHGKNIRKNISLCASCWPCSAAGQPRAEKKPPGAGLKQPDNQTFAGLNAFSSPWRHGDTARPNLAGARMQFWVADGLGFGPLTQPENWHRAHQVACLEQHVPRNKMHGCSSHFCRRGPND